MLPNDLQPDLLTEEALEAHADLERNTSDLVNQRRSGLRVKIKSKVIAQPGNSSDRLKSKVQGVAGDISKRGCQILFPIPLQVGDIYWLTFDAKDLEIGSVFGRCLRCRMVREDAYEAGFKFFNPIDLSSVVESSNAHMLFG